MIASRFLAPIFYSFLTTARNLPSQPNNNDLVLTRAQAIKPPSTPITTNTFDPTLVNSTNDRDHIPVCNPPPLFPITNPADCNEAKRDLLHASGALEPTDWYISQKWTYGSCGIFLLPSTHEGSTKDTFSRLEIARDAQLIANECVTQSHGFRGGFISIGKGAFDVAVLGKEPGGSWWGEEGGTVE